MFCQDRLSLVLYMCIHVYIYIYILVMVHEDTMQTERTRTPDEHRVQNLLLVNSMGLSFAAHVQNVVGRLMRVSSEANRFLDGTLVHSPSQTDQPDGCQF